MFACNQYYYDNVTAKDNNGKAYYIQEQFDKHKLYEVVKDDIQKLSFDDWEDFYTKMQNTFDYEDDTSST